VRLGGGAGFGAARSSAVGRGGAALQRGEERRRDDAREGRRSRGAAARVDAMQGVDLDLAGEQRERRSSMRGGGDRSPVLLSVNILWRIYW
jgi:hypothetical protein